MIRSLFFVHVMLIIAMIGVGGMAGAVLNDGPLDHSDMIQLWLAGIAFGALTAASLTTSFILSKSGFDRFTNRSAPHHSNPRG